MDENLQPNDRLSSETDDSQRVNVTVGSANAQPSLSPEGSNSGAPVPRAQPAETGPAQASQPPTPQVVTSNSGGGKRWPKRLLVIVLIAAVAAGGWFLYDKVIKKTPADTTATGRQKTIPLIRVGSLQADYGKLYPDMAPNDYAFTTNAQMFEGLVRYEGKGNIVPDIASTWSNPDDKTWLFTIKKNIKFHDGHTLTANDVKYSLDTVRNSDSDLAQTFASTITAVDVTGADKVRIATSDPDPTLLNKLTFLYIIDANMPKNAEPSQAGTGPYEIKPGTTPSDQRVQMVAFNGYHGGRPKTQALDFGNEDSVDNLIKAFGNHKYDIVGFVPRDKAQAMKRTPQFSTTESDVDFIGFNTVKPGPVQNKLVREAIRYGLDAGAIGRARGTDVTSLSQLVPPSIPGYNPAIAVYKRDIDKSKELLTQAGYPNGLTLRYSVSTDTPEMNEEVVKEMKQIGITLTIDQHPDFDEFISYFSKGQAELFSVDYTSDTLDALDIYQTTLQSANYDNPKLTDLLNQAGMTVDPAKRLKLLQQAAVIIDQDVAVVPLTTEKDHWLMAQKYTIQQDMPSAYLPVYFYKVHLP